MRVSIVATVAGLLWSLLAATAAAAEAGAVPAPVSGRPNVLLIVADDLAWGDPGFNGSEIATPNLDALAHAGTILDVFYTAPTCSPTRAMLLSGVDHHLAGLGTQGRLARGAQVDHPNYRGRLNDRVVLAPALFAAAGYRTFMAGKWHLGNTPDTVPAARGFDRSLALLDGGASAFADRLPLFGEALARYQDDGRELTALPADFHASDAYAQRLIDDLEADDARPFFGYLAFTAPHWPLQAPRAAIAAQAGRYDDGWAALRQRRLASVRKLGLVPAAATPFPFTGEVPDWETLSVEAQRRQARVMEIYAAMITELDRNVGRVVRALEASGRLTNTLIVFLSDNGPEGNAVPRFRDSIPGCCDNSLENMGQAGSYLWLGPGWAAATQPLLRMYKSWPGEGGVRVPAFVHMPGVVPAGRRLQAPVQVKDVLPTLLALAGIPAPGPTFDGRPVEPISGRSLWPLLLGEVDVVHAPETPFVVELFGRRSVRRGNWKAIYVPADTIRTPQLPEIVHTDRWQLYDLASDPGETIDRAADHPALLQALIAAFEAYAERNELVLAPEVVPY